MNGKTAHNTTQLALDFPHRPSLGKEDFLIAPCNREAVAMIDKWPDWPYFAVCIYGPEGCGKTHLANVFANKVALLTNYPYRIPFVKARSITMQNFRPLLRNTIAWLLKSLMRVSIRKPCFTFITCIVMKAETSSLPLTAHPLV